MNFIKLNYNVMKKEISTLSVMIFAIVFFFTITGCKETPKQESEKSKTEVKDTVKKVTVNTDEIVAGIQKYRAEGEAKLNQKAFTKKEIPLKTANVSENTKQKWERMDTYSEGDKLVRIMLYPHKGVSERTEEFYLKDGKLVFAFIQDIGPKHEGNDTGEPGKEFYFDNGVLIKYVNTSGEVAKNADEEKKMYETRLPYEISELLGVINTSK